MKKIISIMLVITLLVSVTGMSGCKTSPDTVAYKASKTSSLTVEAAMGAWNEYVGQGKATLDNERAVKKAFDKYQAAQIVVLDAAIAYRTVKDAGATADATAAQAKLNAAIAAASSSLADIIHLLTTLNVVK